MMRAFLCNLPAAHKFYISIIQVAFCKNNLCLAIEVALIVNPVFRELSAINEFFF